MSSDDVAVRVRGLSKSYVIAHGADHTATLREDLMRRLRHPFARHPTETFWALNGVDFDVKRGDVLGVIGRNGAGKSTLLKILSRITEPTDGEVEIYGRVGSLLEVGTGFHPELTGRENVYLNGAILGMRKKEIERQFDAIVDFSGVEQFLDTPVKRYSSGMYVRLAFAVAAHLKSEILIIDEVLAVGDADFQKKCLSKVSDVAKDGRTVIFVSHNLAAVQNLCKTGVYLSKGRLEMMGPAEAVVRHYLRHVVPKIVAAEKLADRTDRSGNGKVRLTDFRIEDDLRHTIGACASGAPVWFVFTYVAAGREPLRNVDMGMSIHTQQGETIFVLLMSYKGVTPTVEPGIGEFRCRIDRLPLIPGRYVVGARVEVATEEADWPRDGVAFLDVDAGDFYGTGSLGSPGAVRVLVDGEWELGPVSAKVSA